MVRVRAHSEQERKVTVDNDNVIGMQQLGCSGNLRS